MEKYRTYLINKRLSNATIQQYCQFADDLLAYLACPASEIVQADLLSYVQWLQRRGLHKKTINVQLGSFRHYFAYCMQSGTRADNPAQHLYIRGTSRTSPYYWLAFEELEEVFERYQAAYPSELKLQVLWSLLLFQAMTVSELRLLEVGHIDLKKGKIAVPAASKSNARTLSLDLRQMLLLVQFLSDKQGKLFDYSYSKGVSNQVNRLMKQLKTLHPGIINSKQIRGSVIAHWLRSEDLRIVQYKAGHRYVSSTERYQVAHLEELQAEISQIHPLN